MKHILSLFLGFLTGISRVSFSDTIPVPVNTVPIQPWVWYLQVTDMVSYETHGVGVPAVFWY